MCVLYGYLIGATRPNKLQFIPVGGSPLSPIYTGSDGSYSISLATGQYQVKVNDGPIYASPNPVIAAGASKRQDLTSQYTQRQSEEPVQATAAQETVPEAVRGKLYFYLLEGHEPPAPSDIPAGFKRGHVRLAGASQARVTSLNLTQLTDEDLADTVRTLVILFDPTGTLTPPTIKGVSPEPPPK